MCCLATFSHGHSPSAVFSQPRWAGEQGKGHVIQAEEKKGEIEEWAGESERKRRPITKKQNKNWPVTLDWELEKNISEKLGPMLGVAMVLTREIAPHSQKMTVLLYCAVHRRFIWRSTFLPECGPALCFYQLSFQAYREMKRFISPEEAKSTQLRTAE